MNTLGFRSLAFALAALGPSLGCDAAPSGDASSETAEIQQAGAVRLVSGSVQQACSTCFTLAGKAVVRNIADQKRVFFAYTVGASGVWSEEPLRYVGPAGPGEEVWELPPASIGFVRESDRVEFAVKYVVNGQEHWDNNHGNNYAVVRNAIALAPDVNVLLDRTWSDGGGLVAVRDLGFEKKVTVVYSTDHWATTKSVEARFDRSSGAGVEVWRFAIPERTSLEAAISYSANGQTYWDNNFGRNYSVRF